MMRNLVRAATRIASRLAPELRRAAVRRWPIARIRGTDARMLVDDRTAFGRELLTQQERLTERFVVPMCSLALKPGDVYFDIGAHWGLYTLVASGMVGDAGTCVAVEPFQPSFQVLSENIALNHMGNVHAVHAAVGDAVSRGKLEVSMGEDNLNRLGASHGSGRPHLLSRLFQDECEVTTVAELLRRFDLPRIRLMKMDVEGGECVIAKSLIHDMDRVDVLLLEAHPPFTGYDCDLDLLYRWLSEGRQLFVVDDENQRLERIDAFSDFEAKLRRYYFVSVHPEVGEDWEAFTW